VSVSIDIPEIMTKQFTVTYIRAINVPAGMAVKLITKEKTVTVRGPEELINGIKESDLMIVVDFTNAEIGTAPYKASVYMANEQMESVGVVGTYEVNAEVRKAAEGAND
jgi:hypothetical protein